MTKIVPRLTRPASLADGLPPEPVCRFSVDQYHRMADAGVIEFDARIELLEGWLFRKPKRSPLHCAIQRCLSRHIEKLVGDAWEVSTVRALTLLDSEPEPDLVVVPERPDDYWDRHPGPEDVALVVEVAEGRIERDTVLKHRIYARAGIPTYWLIHPVARQIEVFTSPVGPAKRPHYSRRTVFGSNELIPLKLVERNVGAIPVEEFLLTD